LAATTFATMASAFAAPPHHRVCHKERVHHHWITRCH
jgi:hypothetical protein